MNRAVDAQMLFSHLFLGRCPGVAPGWYERSRRVQSRCPNPNASQSEAMTVAAGFRPRGGSANNVRRGATLEGLDWRLGSGVAPRRALFAHHYSVGSSPPLLSRSRSATSQKRDAPSTDANSGCHA